jgi:hypothetical protein
MVILYHLHLVLFLQSIKLIKHTSNLYVPKYKFVGIKIDKNFVKLVKELDFS